MFNLLPLLFLWLAIAQFKRAESIWFWKFSLAAIEMAHLSVILVLIWVIWAQMRKNRRRWPVYLIGIFFVAVFLRPAISATVVSQQQNLEFSWLKLFSGETYEHLPVKTVEYKPGLTFDFYNPSEVKSARWLVVVHGGGWDSGDSSQIAHFNDYLASHLGITVVSVNYHLAPEYKWPTATQDVAEAINFIKNHATDYHIDPKEGFLLGRSAGGQIAGELAYNFARYNIEQPKGLVLMYSPTDMVFGYEVGEEDDILHSHGLIRNYMGGPPEKKLTEFEAASPLQHVSAQSTPTLMIHGQNDFLTWFKHSVRLEWRLSRLGVPNRLILLPWATHGFDFFLFGPGGQITLRSVERFIETGTP